MKIYRNGLGAELVLLESGATILARRQGETAVWIDRAEMDCDEAENYLRYLVEYGQYREVES